VVVVGGFTFNFQRGGLDYLARQSCRPILKLVPNLSALWTLLDRHFHRSCWSPFMQQSRSTSPADRPNKSTLSTSYTHHVWSTDDGSRYKYHMRYIWVVLPVFIFPCRPTINRVYGIYYFCGMNGCNYCICL
jgi:hypothetical protein